jgi:hypothetical protein
VTPLVLLATGIAAFIAAWLVLRSIGPGFRIGRLLATTPRTSTQEAVVIATSGRPRYVRVDGRIDAEEDFEDADHRPLVFRRTRFQAREGDRWTTFADSRDEVRFTLREGLTAVTIDTDALAEGLVVVPRESVGVAADVADRAPAGMAPATPVRVVIEQISSVEHAIVLGVPVSDSNGSATMGAGLGRPLVLTTLEPPEAMRILARGSSPLPRLAAALLVLGAALTIGAIAWWIAGLVVPPTVAAASPSPAAGGDPRSSGEGPGLVGQPLLAIGAVIGIAIASIVATLLYVRMTGGGRPGEGPDRRR